MPYLRAIINPITKRKYADLIQATFYETFWPYQKFSKGRGTNLGGELLQVPIRLTRNPTGGAGGESSVFPAASHSTWNNLQLRPTYYRNAQEVSHMAMSDTSGNANAFAQALDIAQQEGIEGIQRQICEDLYAGRFEDRAVIFAHSGANDGILTLRDIQSANAYNTRPVDLLGARWLMVGQRVNIYDPANNVLRADNGAITDFTVNAITNTASITLVRTATGAVADWSAGGNRPADGDIIVPFGGFNWGAPSSDNPIGFGVFGLAEICGNVNCVHARLFQNYGINFNRTGVLGMSGVFLNAGAAPITEANLENVLDAIGSQYRRLDEGNRGLLICRREIVNFIKKMRYSDIMFEPRNPATAALGVGIDSLSFQHGDQPLEFQTDPKMIPGTIFFVNQEELEWYEMDPPQVEEKDGQMLRLKQQVSGTNVQYQHIYEILFYTRLQFWSPIPGAHGMISNLTGDPEFGQGNTFLPVY